MKRLRSTEDLDSSSYAKESGNPAPSPNQNPNPNPNPGSNPSRPRGLYHKSSEGLRKGLLGSPGVGSRYEWDRTAEDDREGSRRRSSERDYDGFDRRKGFDRYSGGGGGGGGGRSLMHRSESFCGSSRREFPKGFRSERDRPRREGSVTSWRRIDDGRRDARSSPARGVKEVGVEVKSKSETLSKDSVESKRVDEGRVGSESSSEMEEGELEPEPENPGVEEKTKSVSGSEKEEEDSKEVRSVPRVEEEMAVENLGEKDEVCDVEVGENSGGGCSDVYEKLKEAAKVVTVEENCVDSDVERMEVKESDVEVEAVVAVVEENGMSKGIEEENVVVGEDVEKGTVENSVQCFNFKDKGKAVVVSDTPTRVDDSVVDGNWSEREGRDLITSRDMDMEGPSSRGFELFGSSPVRKQEKAVQSGGGGSDTRKEDKLGFEPLDLTLSLPNVLLPIGAAPGSPGRATSVQSLNNTFRTNSDGFTASVSYSGSQSIYHNPSCSLTTQNSLDNLEQSVKSRPIFQGIDWQALSQNEPKGKDIPLYQRLLMNGNNSNGQSSHAQHSRAHESSSKMVSGLEHQLSFHKQFPGGQSRHHDDVKSPSHSVGSHDIGSNYSFERKRITREKSSGSLYRSSSSKMDQEQSIVSGSADFVESVIGRIVSEPINSMARKFHEMTGPTLTCLKDSIRAILLNPEKRRQVSMLQKSLRDRLDITLETLQKSHRSQLEILVALKTGVPDFLKQEASVSTLELAEIFTNSRCRNPTCRSHVPVDECDCKVCGQKTGFCSSCMCLVCSKFDMASNTCSWVGCDVCLHWCHADCGLRESYIRNGRSISGSHGSTEMQFHCVACDHPSEMFGFVKEVFHNFAKDWTAETLSKELEYVKRIFVASKDLRGKRLHEIAGQMIARLTNKSDLPNVYSYIMGFLNDGDSFKSTSTPLPSVKEQSKPSNGIPGPSQEPAWLKSVYTEKVPQLEISASLLPSYSYDRSDKRVVDLDIQTSTQKEPLFDELESIVRVKLAEAKMFQSRADDARREAEGLQRIAFAKNEKTEEEYTSRIAKLRLAESEQTRKQKFDELQALERSHREYYNMKMRMEAEIKDLLVKMEATKRNLAA